MPLKEAMDGLGVHSISHSLAINHPTGGFLFSGKPDTRKVIPSFPIAPIQLVFFFRGPKPLFSFPPGRSFPSRTNKYMAVAQKPGIPQKGCPIGQWNGPRRAACPARTTSGFSLPGAGDGALGHAGGQRAPGQGPKSEQAPIAWGRTGE